MADVKITVTRNGSYHVEGLEGLEGKVVIVDHQGNEIPYDGEDFWLCRCGHSETKPFCDGHHKEVWKKGMPNRPNP